MLFHEWLLNEAVLSGKTTAGERAYDVYVTNNPKAMEIKFHIENGKKAEAFDENGQVINIVPEKIGFFLKDRKIYDINGKPALKTELGYIHVNKIRKPTNVKVMNSEIKATNDLAEIIKKFVSENDGNGIDIKIGKYIIKDVTGCSSEHIKGDPKCDIALFNSSGKEVGFISHKKEGGPEVFQQYGGISIKSGIDHKEIDSFINDLIKYSKENPVKKGFAVYREVKDKRLINLSVYGPDYGKAFGRDNVHCIGQGNPIITKKGNYFELDFSSKMHINGDVSWAVTGKYKAVFAATFRNGRQIKNKNNESAKNVRGGIYPIALIISRKGLQGI